MLEVENLVFDYPGHRALDDVSVRLERGTITALVGPNGAGKSTLMRLCAALDQPFSGTVRLDGEDVHANPRAAHRRMGFLPDFFGLYDDLTVAQCLQYRAAAQGVPRAQRKTVAETVAERLEIADRLGQKAGTLSRGLRQRLAIAQAVLHEPSFLMLDEPASGLDPSARIGLSGVLRNLARDGMTILVSSHILAELEDYSTHILMLRQGQVVDHAPLTTMGQVTERRVEIRLDFARPITELRRRLIAIGSIEVISCGIDEAIVVSDPDPSARAAMLVSVIEAGLPLASFAPERRSLQDIYLARMKAAAAERPPLRLVKPS
ncbi:ABC transporter ATP-binding protein [Dongia sp.]|jgi:ABC-2 type transport system ATP-binding protein|uniref:ABC transporter ATP-binding protein n=1 Tax=Dongia sp. TaxID=1977262 RepID=UPI0035B332E4